LQTLKSTASERKIFYTPSYAKKILEIDVEEILFGFAECTVPLFWRGKEGEAIMHLSMIGEEKSRYH
jgi:hypothetical protein